MVKHVSREAVMHVIHLSLFYQFQKKNTTLPKGNELHVAKSLPHVANHNFRRVSSFPFF